MIISHRYKAQDTPARRTFEQALTGAFMSAVIKDLRPSALPFVASLIRHYTMVAVAQQCGEDLLDVNGLVVSFQTGHIFRFLILCLLQVHSCSRATNRGASLARPCSTARRMDPRVWTHWC